MSSFNASYKGIGELLNSAFIREEMARRGERVLARAKATAPDATPQGVGYVSSFDLEVGTKVSKKGTRRALARVKNTSPHAIYVEFGGHNLDAHRTLGKALREAGG
jgi:hypothetical protein